MTNNRIEYLEFSMINYNVDSEGIATLEWDLPGRSQNVRSRSNSALVIGGRVDK